MDDIMFQRGSRKHILDWLELGDEPFRTSLNQLLAGTGAEVRDTDPWLPRNRCSPKEARLESDNLGVLTKQIQSQLTDWWLVHALGANTPNWDLAARASINGCKGLVLVEAKAHIGELEKGGKRPAKINTDKDDQDRYERSVDNHKRIGTAIKEACDALWSQLPGICIDRDRHYQVSNRIAFAWKLASLGIPVVLIYLAFLNDTGMPMPFIDETPIRDYLSTVFPTAFLEQPIECGLASMQILVRSQQVLSLSPPRNERDSQATYDKIKDQIVAKQK
jgi:hypothetical protein